MVPFSTLRWNQLSMESSCSLAASACSNEVSGIWCSVVISLLDEFADLTIYRPRRSDPRYGAAVAGPPVRNSYDHPNVIIAVVYNE